MSAKKFAALLLLLSSPAFAGINEAQLAVKKGDYATAIKEYTLLAEMGDINSELTLGVIYAKGEFVERNDKAAEEWLRKAAVHDNRDAQYLLGKGYDLGELGLTQDYPLAAEWYYKAASQGVVLAQVRLGDFYDAGLGVPQNYYQALFWYNRAAQSGNADAQAALGTMNFLGKGFPQNYQIANIWLREAAAQNHANSQSLLGNMYQNGQGVRKDNTLAYALYSLSLNGNTSIKTTAKQREELAQQMTTTQLEASSQLIQQLSKKNKFSEALNNYLANQQK